MSEQNTFEVIQYDFVLPNFSCRPFLSAKIICVIAWIWYSNFGGALWSHLLSLNHHQSSQSNCIISCVQVCPSQRERKFSLTESIFMKNLERKAWSWQLNLLKWTIFSKAKWKKRIRNSKCSKGTSTHWSRKFRISSSNRYHRVWALCISSAFNAM